MLMNRMKYLRLTPLLLLAAFSMAVIAADTDNQTSEPGSKATPAEQSGQASPEPGDSGSEVPGPFKQAPSDSEDAAAPRAIKEFKPTEKIEADSAVSFPIDI